jgi:hypothetical protein
MIRKDRRARAGRAGTLELVRYPVAEEQIVAQNQGSCGPIQEIGADEKRLGQPLRALLSRVTERDAQIAPVP